MENRPSHEHVAPFTKVEIELSLVERFARMVALFPDRIALRDPRRSYSFAQLGGMVRAVAQAIVASASGAQASAPVALLLDHGADTVVAIGRARGGAGLRAA